MGSDNSAFGFGAFVPGFDFLQGLVQAAAKGTSGGMPPGAPDWSKWVAPTLQAEEIEKRIGELKTVQFWLEQNARALAATIQALEVQKMTLATLRGMNVQVQDLASAFGFGTPAAAAAPAAGPYDDMYTHRRAEAAAEPPAAAAAAPQPAAAPAVDPLQWWNALAGQFQQIAATTLQEAAERARTHPAELQQAARQAFDAAGRMASEVAQAATQATRMPEPAPAAPPARPAARKSATRKAPPAPAARKAAPAKAPARPRRP